MFEREEEGARTTGEACANIGPTGIRRRLMSGIFFLVVSGAILAALVTLHAPRGSRALLVLPLFLATLGFFQARAKTCVVLTIAGKREWETGQEITDPERVMLHRQMVGVLMRSAVAAIVATALAYLI